MPFDEATKKSCFCISCQVVNETEKMQNTFADLKKFQGEIDAVFAKVCSVFDVLNMVLTGNVSRTLLVSSVAIKPQARV